MIYFVFNLIIGLTWLMLSEGRRVSDLFVGFVVGFILLTIFSPAIGSPAYIRRALSLVRFLLVFTRLFLISNLQIAHAAVARSMDSIQPRFLTYDIEGLTQLEILLLTHAISLTPGTTTVDVSDDFAVLTIHAFDAVDPDKVRRQIDHELRARILGFTRA